MTGASSVILRRRRPGGGLLLDMSAARSWVWIALFAALSSEGWLSASGPAFVVNRANIRRGKGCCPGSRLPAGAGLDPLR